MLQQAKLKHTKAILWIFTAVTEKEKHMMIIIEVK